MLSQTGGHNYRRHKFPFLGINIPTATIRGKSASYAPQHHLDHVEDSTSQQMKAQLAINELKHKFMPCGTAPVSWIGWIGGNKLAK
jgi:hypothetical protein